MVNLGTISLDAFLKPIGVLSDVMQEPHVVRPVSGVERLSKGCSLFCYEPEMVVDLLFSAVFSFMSDIQFRLLTPTGIYDELLSWRIDFIISNHCILPIFPFHIHRNVLKMEQLRHI